MSYLKEKLNIKFDNKFQEDSLIQEDVQNELRFIDFEEFTKELLNRTLKNLNQICINNLESKQATIGGGKSILPNYTSCSRPIYIDKKINVRIYSIYI